MENEGVPLILIVCPLVRVAVPVPHIVQQLFPDGELAARLHHGVRGRDTLIVHGIRHRRMVGPIPDQYRGGAGRLVARVLNPHVGKEVGHDVAGA